MAEKWLSKTGAEHPLIYIRKHASVRRLRLLAESFIRWMVSLDEFQFHRNCADLIEEVADEPKPWSERENLATALPGSGWLLCRPIQWEERDGIGESVAKLLWFAVGDVVPSERSQLAHREMLWRIDEIFGNLLRPTIVLPEWFSENVIGLAQTIYDDRCFDHLPILADALMDEGCFDDAILNHCRSEGPHVRGCWVIDLLLGKE